MIGIGIGMGIGKGSSSYSPGGFLVSDQYNRADNSLTAGNADTGQAWIPLSPSTWGISGNALYCVTIGNAQCMTLETGITNFEVSTRVTGQLNSATNILNLVPKFVDVSNYLFTRVYMGNLELYKIVAGVLTKIANTVATIADGEYHTLTVRCVGASIKCYLNGTMLIDYTLLGADATTFPTYSQVGFRLSRAGTVTFPSLADSFTVKQL